MELLSANLSQKFPSSQQKLDEEKRERKEREKKERIERGNEKRREKGERKKRGKKRRRRENLEIFILRIGTKKINNFSVQTKTKKSFKFQKE